MSTRFASCVVFLSCAAGSRAVAQTPGGLGLGVKENLDLPFDALGEEDEEDEEAPEVVMFYGTALEGEGFFYVIDRSGSMQDSGELVIAKREVTRNITEFTERVRFGVFFFDKGVQRFPSGDQAAKADSGSKASAISFVESMTSGSGSCPLVGLAAALDMANKCSVRRKVITYVGDGGGHCAGARNEAEYHARTLAGVGVQNYQRLQINAIGVLDVSPAQELFLQSLASMNGGTYKRIMR